MGLDPPRSIERSVRMALSVLVASLVAGCSLGAVGSGDSTTPAPAETRASAPASASVTAAPSAAVGSAVAAVPVDPTLLDMLPPAVAGFPFSPVDETVGEDDPALILNAERMAQGLVIDAITSDFAYASVVVLRDGVFNETYFRSWRDSFDEAACSQAGGVVGNAQSQIAGRTAYIGRCDGGVLTYHVWLEERHAIVSVSSLGDAHFGEQLLEGLKP